MKFQIRLVITLGFLLSMASSVFGQETKFEAPTLATAPKIDGVINQEEWAGALKLTNLTDQASGKQMSERTEAWLAVDENGIYVAIYAFDSQPDKIVARTIQRGGDIDDDDYVGLIIDPLNRRDSSGNSQFFVTAIGTQWENIAGGRAAKKEWRGTWFSHVNRVPDGYVTEMMVPWSLLSFPAGRKSDILFNIARIHARTREVGYVTDMGRPFRQENHPLLKGVAFPTRSLSDQLDLLGYISPEYDEDESPSATIRGGVDVRYKPTETLNAVLSISPDFKNIEGQVEGIGFTRTERFLTDTRPFFSEGSSYFSLSSQHGVGRAFYSNRVDDFDQGFKFFGDFDKHQSLGFLVAREDARRLDSVLKYAYRFGPRTSASAFMTYRDEPGRKSSLIGAKANMGLGNHELGMELMQSDDGGQPGSAGYAYFDTDLPNYFLTFTGSFVQPDFRSRLGLIPFVDKQGGFMFQEYNREIREGWLRHIHFDSYVEDFEHYDGSNLSRSFSIGGNFETRNDLRFGYNYYRETFEQEVGETHEFYGGVNVSNRFKQLGFSYGWGDRDGVYTNFVTLQAQARIAQGLDLGFEHSLLKLAGNREQTIVGLGWEIDPEQSITARFVKTDRDSNWYVAYRRSGGLGLEYFLILGDPNAREYRNRAAFKVVWAR